MHWLGWLAIGIMVFNIVFCMTLLTVDWLDEKKRRKK